METFFVKKSNDRNERQRERERERERILNDREEVVRRVQLEKGETVTWSDEVSI